MEGLWIDLDSRTAALFVPGGIVIKRTVWLPGGGEASEALCYVPCHDHLAQAYLQNLQQQANLAKAQCAAKAAAAQPACAEQPAQAEQPVADVIPFAAPQSADVAPVDPTPEPAA